jgi:hypothetical protein
MALRDMVATGTMHFAFVDDAFQKRPTRHRCGRLVAAGAVIISESVFKTVEDQIDTICKKYGFPDREPFKWSPSRDLWMYKNLVDENRRSFFAEIIDSAAVANAELAFIACDADCQPATKSDSPERDAVTLLIERIDACFHHGDSRGIIIADRKTREARHEEKFISDCLQVLREGTEFVLPKTIFMTLTCPSRQSRLLQLADLITSCTLAFVSGETVHSPTTFQRIRPLFPKRGGRTGGVGVKLHPDFKYANMYHWLFEDTHYWRVSVGVPLPLTDRPYATSADKW